MGSAAPLMAVQFDAITAPGTTLFLGTGQEPRADAPTTVFPVDAERIQQSDRMRTDQTPDEPQVRESHQEAILRRTVDVMLRIRHQDGQTISDEARHAGIAELVAERHQPDGIVGRGRTQHRRAGLRHRLPPPGRGVAPPAA